MSTISTAHHSHSHRRLKKDDPLKKKISFLDNAFKIGLNVISMSVSPMFLYLMDAASINRTAYYVLLATATVSTSICIGSLLAKRYFEKVRENTTRVYEFTLPV